MSCLYTNAQISLTQKEVAGEDLEYSITMIYGQDNLMTTVLLQDLMKHLIEFCKGGTN
ncbi:MULTISPECIES: PTS lactose/cellobiose transporter subunit IIA [Clostridium]|uniref:PTS lactose/cellobiose transporter subunit IIA n=1 Tax=Clostridium TaxID=1485 RepID=UPI0003A06FD4|nr:MULTISPECIES: PTS lactose/cellobiose transporter subunit IIA [Clostridium]MDU1338179.1 PTS lactose/cellobiose transporter subunit IIA [Clostridium butyricum]MDU5102466.1 PTS lactose/cellobiose transporter subunit IIA [Clostridium butyricum]